MIATSTRSALGTLFLCVSLLSCSESRRTVNGVEIPPDLPPDLREEKSATAEEIASRAYPRATWRLTETPRKAMVIAASHIFLSFRGAETFSAWPLFVPRSSERTVEEAAREALSLTNQLRDAPERFGEYAARWSDDVTTAAHGGRLGVFRGDQLPEEALDALAVTPEGDVAPYALRTRLGFHVFRRDALPPSESVSLSRILLGYAGSPDTVELRRRPQRTLAEARALGAELVRRIASDPSLFGSLAREHSDGIEAVRDGDLGELEGYQRLDFPIRRMAAQPLVLGRTPAVVETPLGIEIVARPTTARPVLAASLILIGHVASKSGLCRPANRTRDEAAALAASVAMRAKPPGAFEHLIDEFCDACACRDIEWLAGSADPRIEGALAHLTTGQTAGPFEMLGGYAVVRRDAAKSAPSAFASSLEKDLHLGIPKPPIKGVEDFVTLVDGSALAFFARRSGEYLTSSMKGQLTEQEVKSVGAIYEKLAVAWESRAGRWTKGRMDAWKASRQELVAALGDKKAQEVIQRSSEWNMRSFRPGSGDP